MNNPISTMKSATPTLVVLAAGIGSRYGGLKQIDPIGPGGEAVLDYAIYDARQAGFGKFVFVIRKEIEADFRSAFSRRFENHVDVRYAFQELGMLPAGFALPAERKKPWGTAHATLCAEPQVNEPFTVINADDFYGAESYRILADFLRQPAGDAGEENYAMVGFRLERTLSQHGSVARGVCQIDADGVLLSVEELTSIEKRPGGLSNAEPDGTLRPLTGAEIVSLNFWGFQPAFFGHLRRLFGRFLEQNLTNPKAEFYLPAAVNSLIEERAARVTVLPTPCSWFGVTYREDRQRVAESIRSLIRAGRYPDVLWP